jgi:outer membrane biosynthesis protein TonB
MRAGPIAADGGVARAGAVAASVVSHAVALWIVSPLLLAPPSQRELARPIELVDAPPVDAPPLDVQPVPWLAPREQAASSPVAGALPTAEPVAPSRPSGPRRPRAPSAASPSSAPTVADFTRLTLGRRGTEGWNVPFGDGSGGSGVVGWARAAPDDGVEPRSAPAPSASVLPRAATEPDRSRPPEPPPGLRALLEAHYPSGARAVGAEGDALLRVRIAADGTVHILGELPGSSRLFVEPCRAALRAAGPFTPGLDARGRRATSTVPFRCRFRTVY